MKRFGILLAVLALGALVMAGCVSATATRTSMGPGGTTNQESIQVSGFLERIQQGQYATAGGMTLSVSDATPDQQSIATLAGGVVTLGQAALALAAKAPTNSAATTDH